MSAAISPLAPKTVPEMPPIAGVRLATAAAGIRYQDRTDVMLALFDEGTSVAGVFTRSKCPSAPVEWCRARVKGGARARAGRQFRQCQRLYRQERPRGLRAHRASSPPPRPAARPTEVFLASTGVIGEPLPAQAFDGVMDEARRRAAPEPMAKRRARS